MSNNSPKNADNQEVDLSMISRGFDNLYQGMTNRIFRAIQFVLKHIVVIGILFVLGVGLGLYLDKTQQTYDHQIIVQPNFGSTDYMYAKIDLLQSKIKDNDTLFLQAIGIQDAAELAKIDVEPVIDVYRFINQSEQNFELLKLMSEDSDIKKIVEEKATSKNYPYHLITFKTKAKTTSKKTIEPLMAYLNNSAYFSKLQKEYINNEQIKIKANETIIAQIDAFLNGLSASVQGNTKSSNLVYYNENTQLNDVIQTKNALISEQGNLRIELVGLDKIIKERSNTINTENNESFQGKKKLVLPILFIFVYLCTHYFIEFYRNQKAKQNA